MERLPDLLLEQDAKMPPVMDEGHEWFIYLTEPGGPQVEPSRADHGYGDREPDFVVKVVCTRAFAGSAEQVYAEITRQITLHYRRCYA